MALVPVTSSNYGNDSLKCQLSIIGQQITNMVTVHNSIYNAQQTLPNMDSKQTFTDFIKKEIITLVSIVTSDYYSTVCTIHLPMDKICHERCGLAFTDQPGNNIFQSCACMNSNMVCKVCECGPNSHFHAKVKPEKITKTIAEILTDINVDLFTAADNDNQMYDSKVNQFQETLNQLQTVIVEKYKLIHQLFLSAISSQFNFMAELHANIENMKKEARLIKSKDLRDKAEEEIRKLIELKRDLSSGSNARAILK